MNTEIDWSKAPEDAQFFNNLWYKIDEDIVYFMDTDGVWNQSYWCEYEVLRAPDFILRPIQQNIQQTVQASGQRNVQMNKPPIDLMPKNIFVEQMQHQRRQDIHAAMQRYIEAGKEIPNEWLEELMGLNNTLAGIETDFAEAIQSLPVAKDDGWIEWGKNEVPEGLEGYTIELEYTDGEYRKGRVGEYTWNDDYYVIDCDTVKRYRIIGKE